MSAGGRTFNIGDPVRIVTARPLEAFLRGNVRHRRPGLCLRPASFPGAQGFITATTWHGTDPPAPAPIGHEVTFYAPAELPAPDVPAGTQVPWFPAGLPRPARLLVRVAADELEPDPAPPETWEAFWRRQADDGEDDVDAQMLLIDAEELLDVRSAVRDPAAWRAAFLERFPGVGADWIEMQLKAAQDHWVRERVEDFGGIPGYLERKTEWEGGGLWTAETEEAFAAIRAAEAGDRTLLHALLDIYFRESRPYPIEIPEPRQTTEAPTTACFDCDAIVPVADTWVNRKGLALCEACFTRREAKGRARRGRHAREEG